MAESLDEAPVRVVIVDDHELTRNGMVAELDADQRIEVIGAFGSLLTVPHPARSPANTDVVVVDLSLPHEVSGTEAVEAVVPWGIPVVVCTMVATSVVRDLVKAAGAIGFVSKRAAAAQLVDAVLCAHRGQYFEAGVESLPSRSVLSAAEVEVTAMVAKGMSSPEIAAATDRQHRTVDALISTALEKLGLGGRARGALAAWAARAGLADDA